MRWQALIGLTLLALLVTIFPAAAQDNNLLQNGGFESEVFNLVSIGDDGSRYHLPIGWGGAVVQQPGSQPWQNVHDGPH